MYFCVLSYLILGIIIYILCIVLLLHLNYVYLCIYNLLPLCIYNLLPSKLNSNQIQSTEFCQLGMLLDLEVETINAKMANHSDVVECSFESLVS